MAADTAHLQQKVSTNSRTGPLVAIGSTGKGSIALALFRFLQAFLLIGLVVVNRRPDTKGSSGILDRGSSGLGNTGFMCTRQGLAGELVLS